MLYLIELRKKKALRYWMSHFFMSNDTFYSIIYDRKQTSTRKSLGIYSLMFDFYYDA